MSDKFLTTQKIKEYAATIGFDACGICKAEKIKTEEEKRLIDWLSAGYHADMEYLSRNTDKRIDPALLVEGAKSIICVALNYYPQEKQPATSPQFAYYAYGKDYHDVVKAKLKRLFDSIQELVPETSGRVFVDTAPVLERHWAAKAGIGFIGKNTMLILPRKGSYFFIGVIVLDVELIYDTPLRLSCGSCRRCLDACPTQALDKPYRLNSKKCISYQTIENKGEIDREIVPSLNGCVYGCDICQQVCPWNRFAKGHQTEDFLPVEEFLKLDYEILESMTEEDYRRIFKGSAVKRAKYAGLMRNLKALKSSR